MATPIRTAGPFAARGTESGAAVDRPSLCGAQPPTAIVAASTVVFPWSFSQCRERRGMGWLVCRWLFRWIFDRELTVRALFEDDSFYASPPLGGEIIRRAEGVLGVRLPRDYIQVLCQQNGGVLRHRCFPTDFPTSWPLITSRFVRFWG